jgi:regulator of protease activity HflC (stomatin/prohibitin superfamily)
MSIKRTIGMIALACTGIGALYMWSRLQWIKPNHVGLVLNYQTQKYEELLPGWHCILSPFRSYVAEVSKQLQVCKLETFSAKSLDNVDTNVQADITYTITKPEALYTLVNNPISTFKENLKMALSSAIQTLTFPDITSAEINELFKKSENVSKTVTVSSKTDLSLSASSSAISIAQDVNIPTESASQMQIEQSARNARIVEHGVSFFRDILQRCAEWGIKIHTFRIITCEPKHKRISDALELTAEAKVRAQAQLLAASSQAETIRTLANAEKDAQITRAHGAVIAGKELTDNSGAMEVYALENRVRTAEALGRTNGVLVNLSSDVSLASRSFAAFSGGQSTANLTADNVSAASSRATMG